MVDPDTMSVVELYHVVITAAQNIDNDLTRFHCSRERPKTGSAKPILHCANASELIRTAADSVSGKKEKRADRVEGSSIYCRNEKRKSGRARIVRCTCVYASAYR